MADWQHAFLSKVILDEELKDAVNAGITIKFFRDPHYARVYEFLLDHWTKHSTAPDAEVVAQAFPTQKWKPQKQALSYLVEQMRRDRKYVLITQGLSEAANFMGDEDADSMLEVLSSALLHARLETSPARDMDITQYRGTFFEDYDDRMEDQGVLRGISSGFDGIDYVTGGWQPEQFIVLIGTPKSFKSATLLAMAKAAHEQAKLALFVGFEMSASEQVDRLLALLAEVGLTKILRATTTQKEYRRLQQAFSRLEAMREFIFSTDITAGSTVSSIQAKIVDYHPDVVFVDGAYLMQSELEKVEQGSPQALTNISRNLKRLAQAQKIPIVVTTQASLPRSKGGLSLHSAMYSQAWGQDCDVMLGVERVIPERPDEQVSSTDGVQVRFRVLESRSGPRRDTVLEWDWSRGSVMELDEAKMRAALDRKANRAYLYDNDED